MKLPQLTCPKCGYKWTPRVPQPKKCPACGYRLKWNQNNENEACVEGGAR